MQLNRVGLLASFVLLATGARGGGGCGGGGGSHGTGGRGGAADASSDADAKMSDGGPAVCITSTRGSVGQGDKCGCDADCAGGVCADGVCCKTACSDKCMSCKVPGSMGLCTLVPFGDSPDDPSECKATATSTCGEDGKCDGAGACRKFEQGTVCAAGQCAGDGMSGGKVCDGQGACTAG